MTRALWRLADAAARVALAWVAYQLAKWLLVADRGLGCSVEVDVAVNMAPIRPGTIDDDDAALGPYRDAMGGRP